MRKLDRRQLRRRIGAVVQAPYLFGDTIAANIALGEEVPDLALDTESEATVKPNLDRVLEQRTAVIVAHCLTTIRDADAAWGRGVRFRRDARLRVRGPGFGPVDVEVALGE